MSTEHDYENRSWSTAPTYTDPNVDPAGYPPADPAVEPPPPATGRPRVGRHPLDAVSLVFGGLFVGAALIFGLIPADRDLPGAGWYVPALLIVVGLLGLAGTLFRGRRTPG